MRATADAVRGVFCANPVHTRIIADRTAPKSTEAAFAKPHYSPIWCKNKGVRRHYFGARKVHCTKMVSPQVRTISGPKRKSNGAKPDIKASKA